MCAFLLFPTYDFSRVSQCLMIQANRLIGFLTVLLYPMWGCEQLIPAATGSTGSHRVSDDSAGRLRRKSLRNSKTTVKSQWNNPNIWEATARGIMKQQLLSCCCSCCWPVGFENLLSMMSLASPIARQTCKNIQQV